MLKHTLFTFALLIGSHAKSEVLTIYSEFPSHWVKGTWLNEVAKEYTNRYGVNVNIVDYHVKTKKK